MTLPLTIAILLVCYVLDAFTPLRLAVVLLLAWFVARGQTAQFALPLPLNYPQSVYVSNGVAYWPVTEVEVSPDLAHWSPAYFGRAPVVYFPMTNAQAFFRQGLVWAPIEPAKTLPKAESGKRKAEPQAK